MPLPIVNTEWPPKKWKIIYNKYAEWSAWYSSDLTALVNLYTDHFSRPYIPENQFDLGKLKQEIETYLHVPVASDISQTSANLLFSEQPLIRIPEAQERNPSSSAKATSDRLETILEQGQFYSKIVEAAESASALGGVFLKPNWDAEFLNIPIIDVVQADNAIPLFQWGFLKEVLFHKIVFFDEERNKTYRLIEYHGKGFIVNALYVGTATNIGKRIPLEFLTETQDLEEQIDTGIKDILVRYIPNIKPNRLMRGSGLGNSDYQGIEGLFDSINTAYTSWIKEIRIGQARIIVPEQWLERKNGHFNFNIDREVFTALDIDPLNAKGLGIEQVQFELRTEDFKTTTTQLILQAVESAGYSPQSFGFSITGSAESGTALNVRERKSIITKSKKEKFFTTALQDMIQMLLAIDKDVFKTPNIDVFVPNIEYQDSLSFDLGQTSQTILTLNSAQAVSTQVKVQMAHPEWNQAQVKEEVAKILAETGISTINIDGFAT